MMATPKFRITRNMKVPKAKRYRYAIVTGASVQASSEGYPTHQHVTRAIEGLWKGLAKVFGAHVATKAIALTGSVPDTPPVPYAADSLKAGDDGPTIRKVARSLDSVREVA